VGERRSDGVVQDPEVVTAAKRSEAGVEIIADGARPTHGHVGRKEAIGAADPGALRSFDLRVEVDDLIERMHARIGTTGTDRRNRNFR